MQKKSTKKRSGSMPEGMHRMKGGHMMADEDMMMYGKRKGGRKKGK